MVKVKCILNYFDTKFNRSVRINEEYEVSEARADQLIKAKVSVTTSTTEKVAKAKKPRAKKEA